MCALQASVSDCDMGDDTSPEGGGSNGSAATATAEEAAAPKTNFWDFIKP